MPARVIQVDDCSAHILIITGRREGPPPAGPSRPAVRLVHGRLYRGSNEHCGGESRPRSQACDSFPTFFVLEFAFEDFTLIVQRMIALFYRTAAGPS